MKMYKTCSRCGKIHELGAKCYANSRNYYKPDPTIREFRNSTLWKAKTEEVRTRDKQLCLVCLSRNIFNYKRLSVHHITPLTEDWSRRLDNGNLITVCEEHHRQCEHGEITREEQYRILNEHIEEIKRSSSDTINLL